MDSQKERIERRRERTRSKIAREGVRLSISRSHRYLFAQLIDQKTGKTLLGLSDKKLLSPAEIKGKTKTERAKEFGRKFAQEVLKQKIQKAVFDRGEYRYHGRIRAFVEGVREGGLTF